MTWDIYLRESGTTYTYDGTIPRPNANMETRRSSTMTKVRLADGANAFMTPEHRYGKEAFEMIFIKATTDLRTRIETYMVNGDKVKIITHTGEEFIGKFVDYKRVWFTGIEPDEYDLSVSFEQTEEVY
jgi:hypothetical protein